MSRDNVVFVTLDSCRLDTARLAATPNLDRVGPLTACHTTATFTLPAHLSFFSGFLPVPKEAHKYLGEYDRLWRSRAARPTSKRVYQWIEAPTIIEHYRSDGYFIRGLGGVQFFDPANPANMLPAMFDDFEFHGASAAQSLVDTGEVFTAQAMEALLTTRRQDAPFFVFANLSETHFPYRSPGCAHDEATSAALDIMRAGATDKRIDGFDDPNLCVTLAAAHRLQVHALEWIDGVLGRVLTVLSALPDPTLLVVCADHGESFGERGMIGHGHPAPEVMDVPMWVGRIAASA